MPKPKPDQVIRHEIVLGSVERDALKDMRTAYAFNRVATPTVNLLNDGSGLYALATLVELLGLDIPYLPTIADIPDGYKWLSEIPEQMRQYEQDNAGVEPGEDRSKPTDVGGVIYNLKNPNWNLGDFSWDAITGGLFRKF